MGNPQDAPHGSIAGDSQARHGLQSLPLRFDHRNQADIGRSVCQAVSANRRNFKGKVKSFLPGTMLQAPDEWTGIQEADGANSEAAQPYSMAFEAGVSLIPSSTKEPVLRKLVDYEPCYFRGSAFRVR